MTIGTPEAIGNLEALGKPGELAARVVATCGGHKR